MDKGFANFSTNLDLICSGVDLEQLGRKLHESESYLLKARYLKKEYNFNPSDWDEDYPEDMDGKWFNEDINGIVSIDNKLAERRELQKNGNGTNNRNGRY